MSDMQEFEALMSSVEVPPDFDADQLLADLTPEDENGLDKSRLYAEQESTVAVGSEEETAPVDKPGKRSKGKKKGAVTIAAEATNEAAESTVLEDAGPLTRSAALKKKADVSGLRLLGYSDEEIDAILQAIDAAPKKVGEKASNLLRYALGREHISNYTRYTLIKLRDADNRTLTVPGLVKLMMDERGYQGGTARSQSQQMSRLFALMGMVVKDGSSLTLDGDNRLTKAALSRLAGDPFVGHKAEDQASEGDNIGDDADQLAA